MSEKMTEEERAVWIGERLFGLTPHKDDSGFLVAKDSEHSALEGIFYGNGNMDKQRYVTWLSSPDGIAAVKAAMIERGYSLYLDYNAESKEWCCDFFFPKKHQGVFGNTESEAILSAAYKALKGEENNANH